MRSLLFALALAWPSAAWAWECNVSEIDADVPLAWPTRTIPYAVQAGIGVPLADIEAAFDTWSEVSCSDLDFEIAGVVAPGATGTVLTAVEADWEHDPDAVASTAVIYVQATGEIRSGLIELNHAQHVLVDVTTGCDGAPIPHDTRAVLIHEIGHLVGLAHTTAFVGGPDDPTMSPQVDPCDATKRSLEPDDVAALCALYPIGARGACHGRAVRAPASDDEAGGCTTTGGGFAGWSVFALLLLGLKTCRNARSGG